MKELKPKIRDIRVKQPPHNHCLRMPVAEPIKGLTTGITALQPQVVKEDVPQGSKMGWQRLMAQAERINQLSAELEEAMLEFKVIANEVNCERRITQATKKQIKSVCKYLKAIVPCVKYKKGSAFVLTTRPVDLFRAEREASQVAQALRRRAKIKVMSPLSRKNKRPVLGWLT